MKQSLRTPVLQYLSHPFGIDRLPSEQQVPQGTESRRHIASQLIEQGRRQEQDADFLFADLMRELARRKGHIPGDSNQTGSMQQRSPDFKSGGVETRHSKPGPSGREVPDST